jgi:hypothetical protein
MLWGKGENHMKRASIFCMILIAAFSSLMAVHAQETPDQIEAALESLSAEVGQTVTRGNLQNWQWMEQVFPDASLGCPQPDVSYAQVLTRGFQFQLQYRGQVYDYRVASDGSNVILCSISEAAAPAPTSERPDATPTVPPAVVSTPNGDVLDVAFEAVQFSLDSALASSVSASTIEAVEQSDDVPFFGVHPAYVEFQLLDYAEPRQGVTPTISIYPLADFEDMLPDIIPPVSQTLQTWITSCPQMPSGSLPHLAPVNASQVFAANLLCLDFESGQGLRYLTVFSQGVSPFTQQDLLYIYQGISTDRQYYVSAVIPVTTDVLPETVDAASVDAAFVQNYTAYINETIDSLTLQNSNAFTPDLRLLDNMVSSITISGVGPAPQLTPTQITWDEAQELIEAGSVTAVTQFHSLEVRLLLEDGSLVVTRQPAIDNVLTFIRECGQPCASIVFATE